MTTAARFVLCATLVAGSSPALAQEPAPSGPFGLRMGMTKAELGPTTALPKTHLYKLASVPKPHPAIESYIVRVAPKSGLCWVKAVGRDVRTNNRGTELRGEFDTLYGQLVSVYGPAKKIDRLFSGSIWKEPQDWMAGLLKGDRVYAAQFPAEKDAPLKFELTQVFLFASATRTDEGYVGIEYSFANERRCEAEAADAEKSAL